MFPEGSFGVFAILITFALGAAVVFGVPLGYIVIAVVQSQQKKKLSEEQKAQYISWSCLVAGAVYLIKYMPSALDALY